jgi:periplasmic divalent cation tolerance protein
MLNPVEEIAKPVALLYASPVRYARTGGSMSIMFVYVTAADGEEAKRIGRQVVEEELAACANILPGATSIFRWQGKLEEAPETILILKTTEQKLEPLISRVKSLHSYDCPCIEALPVVEGNRDFLEWVVRQTGGDPKRLLDPV